MPRRSLINFLPPAVKDALDERLVASHFSRYEEHTNWLARQGHPIGKSSVHRYGEKLEKRRQIWLSPMTAEMRADEKLKQAATRREQVNVLQYTGMLVIVIDPATRETIIYATARSAQRTRELIEGALFTHDATAPKERTGAKRQ